MPQDKVKEVYGLISDLGYFKDENEFKTYVSDPKKRKEAFELISDTGYFKDEKEFNSYFTDIAKTPQPPTGPQPETPQPRNKVAEMLNQPKAVDKLKQVVPTSEVASGTKKPKEILTEDVKAFKESQTNELTYQKVTQKAAEQNIGTTELFKRESDGLSQFLTDDNKAEFDYYKQIDDATRRVNELTARTEATGNPITQADLQKAKFDKFKAQQQLLKYEKDKVNAINNEIAKTENIINTSVNQDPEMINNLKKSVEDLKEQRDNPNYLKNPDEKVKQIYSQVGGEIDTFKVPGATPREKIQNYALILKQQLDDIENKIREIDPNVPLDQPTFTSGYDLARQNPQLDVLRERRMNLIPKLQVVAPIALINKMPTKDNDWFGSSFSKAVKAELLPDKFTKQNITDMSDNEVSELIYNNNVITSLAENDLTQSAITKSKQLGAPVKPFSGNWWGNLAGTSASMIPAFALGSGAVQGVSTLAKIPSVLNMTKRLYRVSNIAKNMQLGKYVVPTLKSAGKGIEYMAAEPFLNQEGLKDEASFLSGFLGQAVAGPMGRALSGKNVGNLVSFLFKENAPDAAKLITTLGNRVSSGLGEYGEEVGNTIGPLLDTYIKTGDFQNLKKDLSENFGTLDANLELFVGSVVMGMAMGGGSGIGKASMENSKKIYEQLTPEQQKQADDIANALKNDVEKAEVQAKKEEIQEGAEPLAEDILTEEDKQKKTEAIEKLNNPASTVAEKVEAGRVLNDIKIKEHDAKITEKALKESPVEEVVSEEAFVETPSEEVAVEETPIAKGFDFEQLFEEQKAETPEQKQKVIDDIREEEYQKSSFDKKWAGTYQEAKTKLVEQYNKAKQEKETWESKSYKSAGDKSVFVGGELEGNDVSVNSINEKRKRNNIKNAQSDMDSAKKDLASLGLTKNEINDLLPTTQQPQATEEIVETPPSEVVSEEVITPKEEVGEVEVEKTALKDVDSTAKALEEFAGSKSKKFNPDDKAILTTKDGKEIEVSFRGYNSETKAVVFGSKGSGIDQMEIDVSQLRAKRKSDKLSKKERDELLSKIDFQDKNAPSYNENFSDKELQDLSVKYPKESKLTNKEKQERNDLQIAITPLKQWQEQEYGVDDPNDPVNIKLAKEHKDAIDNIITNNKYSNLVSQAYHKAKADGSNPELVKAVEDLLSPNEQTTPYKEQAKEVVSEDVKQETPKKEVVKEQDIETKVKELTEKRDVEIVKASKPSLKLDWVSVKDIAQLPSEISKDKKEEQAKIKTKYKELLKIMDCL